jgi:hypothetical protein
MEENKSIWEIEGGIKLDYKEQWLDMKRWLREGIDYCDKGSFENTDSVELNRLSVKANSLRLVLQHMLETEKIFSSIAVSEF